MAINFPGTLDTTTTLPATAGAEVLNTAGGGKGLSPVINDYATALIATETKIGSGSSTPTNQTALVGNGVGTSTWSNTLTNFILNTPTLNGSGGALTLPAGPDSLVGRATTDTLTNKTLTSPIIATPTIRTFDGWQDANETWTYTSASTITVPTGAASKYAVGDRIKWTQTTVKYGVIIAVADTLLTIAINTDYVVTNAAISANYYSHEASPIGYPQWFNYTQTWTILTVGNGTPSSKFSMNGKVVTTRIGFTLGSTSSMGSGVPNVSLPITAASYVSAAHLGNGIVIKNNTGEFPVFIEYNSATLAQFLLLDTTTSYGTFTSMSATVPFTWAANDRITATITYEAV